LASDIAAEIAKNNPNGTCVVYDNALVKGDLSLDNLGLPIEKIELNDYESDLRGLSMKDVKVINSKIKIINSTIEGKLDFSDAKFLEKVSFNNTTFNDVDFAGSLFECPAIFDGCTFNGASSFLASSFKISARFGQKTKFNGPVEFDGSEMQSSNFEESIFNSSASFKNSIFKSSIFFDKSKFFGPAEFSSSDFDGIASFVSSSFNQSATFKDSRFIKEVYFRQSKFNGPAVFVGAKFSNGVRLEYASFYGIGDFSDVVVKYIDLEKTKIDEFYSNWDVAKSKLKLDDDNRRIRIYQHLRKDYLESNLLDDANDCYYEIMKVKSHLIDGDWALIVVDRSQRYLYGYGMKPIYPLIWSCFFIILFSLLFKLIRLEKPLKPFSMSYNVFLSGTGKLLIEAPKLPEDCTEMARFLYDVERFLGLLFFSLFLITIAKVIS
jgi:uncharacterized protein YjbI with pentapeptide repeats